MSSLAVAEASEKTSEWFEYGAIDAAEYKATPDRPRPQDPPSLKDQFDVLADELEEAAGAMASPRKAMRHPAYGEILALGRPAIPLALERMQESGNRPLWMRLLGSLTGIKPSQHQVTIGEAERQWLRWGCIQGVAGPR